MRSVRWGIAVGLVLVAGACGADDGPRFARDAGAPDAAQIPPGDTGGGVFDDVGEASGAMDAGSGGADLGNRDAEGEVGGEEGGDDMGAEPDAAVDLEPIPYTNPVLNASGDPDALKINGMYYVFLPRQIRKDGNPVGGKVVAYTSKDLVHWRARGEVYNNQNIAYGGNRSRGLWAPEVLAHNGRFYLYAVNVMSGGRDASTVGNKDIVVISSTDPLNFNGQPQKVLLDDGYAFIDPSPFVDPKSGDMFLLYKRRGRLGTGSSIHIRPMSGPRGFSGPATRLVHSDEFSGSQNIVEHPMLHYQGGVYFFLFSYGKGDDAGAEGYRVRYATSRKPMGPYTQRGILLGRDTVDGGKPIWAPGATSVVRDGDNRAWLVYRQKTTRDTTFANRAVCIERLLVRPNANPPSMAATPTRGIERDGPTPLSAP